MKRQCRECNNIKQSLSMSDVINRKKIRVEVNNFCYQNIENKQVLYLIVDVYNAVTFFDHVDPKSHQSHESQVRVIYGHYNYKSLSKDFSRAQTHQRYTFLQYFG